MFVIREILEVATSVPDAIAMLHNFPHCVSNNFDFADAKGRLASAEVGPGGRVSAMQTTGPYIVHTNEFLWDQWAIARQASVDPTSVARQTALRAFLNSTAAAGGFHSSLDSIQNRYAKPPIFQGSVGPPMQPTPAGIYTSVVLIFDVVGRTLHYLLPFEPTMTSYRHINIATRDHLAASDV